MPNPKPVTDEWLEDRSVLNSHGIYCLPTIAGCLHVIACNHFYDGIEFWQGNEDGTKDGVLLLRKYPITVQDIEGLLAILDQGEV